MEVSGSGVGIRSWSWIRKTIQEGQKDTDLDPDPEHCFNVKT